MKQAAALLDVHSQKMKDAHKTPLRYPGGKQRIAPFIAAILSANRLDGGDYSEPYAGGAGVAIHLLLSGRVRHIHLNDSFLPLYSFWRSVLYHTDELCGRIRDIPLSVDEWRHQKEVISRPWEFDQLDLGFSMLYLNRCNRSGIIHRAGLIGGLRQQGEWKMDARFPRQELVRRVVAIAQRRSDITLRNWDAERFIEKHISELPKRSLVYCDPPYFHNGERLYPNHYKPDDHRRIAKVITEDIAVPWVVSYDYIPPIVQLYERWRSFTYRLQYSAARVYKGREMIVLSPGLRLPRVSNVPFIDRALWLRTQRSKRGASPRQVSL